MSAGQEGYDATMANSHARNPYREDCGCKRHRPWNIGAVRATQELRDTKHEREQEKPRE